MTHSLPLIMQRLMDDQADEAIALLIQNGVPADAVSCALLARAYARRNDSRGDHYAAAWFARRARDLGSRDDFLPEIIRRYEELSSHQGMAPMKLPKLKRRPFKALSVKHSGAGTEPKDFDWIAKNIPCQEECPAKTDIPGYLTAVFNGDYDLAYRINLEANVFPGVLGRVCARPCESRCRHGWQGLGEPVGICNAKRAAADHRREKQVRLEPLSPKTGKSVGIVGAGPAGLTVARELGRLGHDTTVYEKHSQPGGMMVQGIPEFRLPRDVVEHEIAQAGLVGGILWREPSGEIGGRTKLGALLAKHDAVVVATGTLKPNLLDLPGAGLAGIRHGLDFLLEANTTGQAKIGRNVVVIGGGFTAMDCARMARRMLAPDGLEAAPATPPVQVFYRRSRTEMLVTPGELEALEHEGIPMAFMAAPTAYVGDNGRVVAVEFVRTEMGEPDASGRRRPVVVPGSEFRVPADTVLLATGQFPDTGWVEPELRAAVKANGDWQLEADGCSTPVPRLFVAGDAATGASSIIHAIGHAKRCVAAVDALLAQGRRRQEAILPADAEDTGRIREMDAVPRLPMPELPLPRRGIKAEVETGLAPEQARDEAQRCYRCHFKYEIDSGVCIYCDWCIKAKPRPECILRVKSFHYDAAGRITGWEKAQTTDETYVVWINQNDCIRCGACLRACPTGAIELQKVCRGHANA